MGILYSDAYLLPAASASMQSVKNSKAEGQCGWDDEPANLGLSQALVQG